MVSSTHEFVTFPLPLPWKHTLGAPLLHLSSSALTSKSHIMESSSVSTGGSLRIVGPTRCFCGEKPVVVVLWTTNNLGRRFYKCPNFWVMSNTKGKFCFFYYYAATYGFNLWFHIQVGRKCKFFKWRDDEICGHGTVFIPEQRQMIITLKSEIVSCKRREKFLARLLALSLVISGICLCVVISLVG